MFQNELGHSSSGRYGGQPPSPRVHGPADRQQHIPTETTRQRGVCLSSSSALGAIQVLRNAVGGGRVLDFPKKKHYEGVRFNVISVTRG